jgi:hypothetical protein
LCWLSSTDGSPATACKALKLFFRNPNVLFIPSDHQSKDIMWLRSTARSLQTLTHGSNPPSRLSLC